MKTLTLEDKKELERMWCENAAPVKVAAMRAGQRRVRNFFATFGT